MKNKKALKTTGIVLGVVLVVFAAAVITSGVTQRLWEKKLLHEGGEVKEESFDGSLGDDRIHFLNTFNSDAILIESNGKFALIDSGEDSDNPTGKEGLELTGYEDKVLEYLKAHAADENGKVTLEFILGTHSHSDHIGGFDTIINDEDVIVKKAYLKEYREETIVKSERKNYDNSEVYEQMKTALDKKGIETVSVIPSEPFTFGDFTISFYNTEYTADEKLHIENNNSVLTLIEKDGKRILLAGDFDDGKRAENEFGSKIGKVDILKAPHHGFTFQSTRGIVKGFSPEKVIVTNDRNDMSVTARWDYTMFGKAPIYETAEYDGIIVSVKDGELALTHNIHS